MNTKHTLCDTQDDNRDTRDNVLWFPIHHVKGSIQIKPEVTNANTTADKNNSNALSGYAEANLDFMLDTIKEMLNGGMSDNDKEGPPDTNQETIPNEQQISKLEKKHNRKWKSNFLQDVKRRLYDSDNAG
jgi:hypothetical protein